MAYSFAMTTAICWIMHFIPFLRLRSSEEEEIVGLDEFAIGEYTHDYIGLDPELRMSRLEGEPMMYEGKDEKASRVGSSVATDAVPVTTEKGLPGGTRVDA